MTGILTHSPVSRSMPMVILFAAGCALFTVLFPWDAITKTDGFWDFNKYVDYYNRVNADGLHFHQARYYANERFWFELVRWLTAVTGDAAIALRCISFFIVFVWAILLIRCTGYTLALLFLFNPFAINIYLSIMRNGLAWTFFMIGLVAPAKTLRPLFFLAGGFTHSSTWALVIFHYAAEWFKRIREFKNFHLLFGLGIALIAGFLLTVGVEIVGTIIEDRRLRKDYASGGGSLLQASLWGILLCLQCTSGRRYIEKNLFVISILAWYLVMNMDIPWSYRIWSAFLPVIAASALDLPTNKRKLFLLLYSGYLFLAYMYWTKLFYYWYPL